MSKPVDTQELATQMLGLVLKDAVRVLRNEDMPPEARGFAHRVARNIVAWEGGTGVLGVTLSFADTLAISSEKIVYGPGMRAE